MKRKFIAGATAISMICMSPSVVLAEDDVVVFGDNFENKKEVTPIKSESNEQLSNQNENANDVKLTDKSDESDTNNIEEVKPSNNQATTSKIALETNNNATTEVSNNEVKKVPVEDNQDYENIGKVLNFNDVTETNFGNGDSVLNAANEIDNPAKLIDNQTKPIDNPDDIEIYGIDKDKPVNIRKSMESTNDNQEKSPDKRYTKENENTSNDSNKNQNKNQKKELRFVKLTSDDTYDYYLDRESVRWMRLPYSSSEYMADIWIRMLEKSPSNDSNVPSDLYDYINTSSDDISMKDSKGKLYNEADLKILKRRKYFLEHYYLRPQKRQIQFLCELEVVGHPQNSISERKYDYKNWEDLIPGSVEAAIYNGVLSMIGKSKSTSRGHMTAVDMIEEYLRISLG